MSTHGATRTVESEKEANAYLAEPKKRFPSAKSACVPSGTMPRGALGRMIGGTVLGVPAGALAGATIFTVAFVAMACGPRAARPADAPTDTPVATVASAPPAPEPARPKSLVTSPSAVFLEPGGTVEIDVAGSTRAARRSASAGARRSR